MINRLPICLSVPILLLLQVIPVAAIQQQDDVQVIADFEGENPVATSNTTHKASVTVVEDAPEGGGDFAARTVADESAGAAGYFGTGFDLTALDLSDVTEIKFWIKTDIQSEFNFQIHSEDNRASVFRFSTVDVEPETWHQVTASVASFTVPRWSQGEAEWERVNKWQVTAFGNGPYDGKQLVIDNVIALETATPAALAMHEDRVERGGPILTDPTEPAPVLKAPPEGFRSLFDGETFEGWTAMPRLPIPRFPGAPFKMPLEGERLEAARRNTGKWTIEDGAIVGGQEPAGSGVGAYLVSEETFGNFELIMDMKPDWKTDSGILIRTSVGGSPGMQVLVDHRPQGGIGGFYGNGLVGLHGMPFAIDAEYDDEGNPIRMIAASPDADRVELNERTRAILSYAADVDDFLEVWKFGEWNTIKVRCEGRIPKLTTWVNGLKIAELDMSQVEWEDYDAEACAELVGRRGHISLEVHNSHSRDWLGMSRWWPGAVVRWKNIFIRELE